MQSAGTMMEMSESLLSLEGERPYEEGPPLEILPQFDETPLLIETEEAVVVQPTRRGSLPLRTTNGTRREHGSLEDPVKLYLDEIARYPLLKGAEEEAELMKQIESGLFAERILSNGEQVLDAEVAELEGLMRQGRRAFDTMQESNLRLVVSVAKKYTGRGMEFLDLIQEGSLGLRRAVEMFDYTRGFKFSTYASWWIRQSITRAIADQSRTVRIPISTHDQIGTMERARREIINDGRDATPEAIADHLEGKFSVDKVTDLIRISQAITSLNKKVATNDETEFGELLEDTTAESPEDTAANEILPIALNEILSAVITNEKHRRVIEYHFGLNGHEASKTLEETGKKVGLTRERVRQVITKYLGDGGSGGRIHEDPRTASLKDYLD